MRTLFLLSIAGLALAQAPPEPTDIQGWIRQSLELARAGKQDDALKAINRGLELDANNLAALHTLAYVQFNKGMLQQARDTYQKILMQKPESREALYGLGAVAAVNVEAARKQARAEAGLAMDAPGPIPIAGTRAQYQNEIGPIIQEGIQNLERALQIDPAFVPAMGYLSQLIRARADYAQDAETYKREILKANEWSAKMQPPAAAAGPPTSANQIRVGGEIQKAKLQREVPPVYPPMALQARIQGIVRLNVVIGEDGRVRQITVHSGHPLMVPAAQEAVQQYQYQPTLLNGKPVEVVTQVDVNFKL
jgi:TonB family protein